MQVYLDDALTNLDPPTVGRAIEAAATLVEAQGRLIVEVEVDGRAWSETELGSPIAAARKADAVKLVSVDPRRLVSYTLGDAADALGHADSLQREAAELIQSDQPTEAMSRLSEAFEIWSAVQQAVLQGSQLLEIDLDTVEVQGQPLSVSIAALNTQLGTVRDALQQGDPVGLSDALLYELPEVVATWQELLNDLRRRVDDTIDADAP